MHPYMPRPKLNNRLSDTRCLLKWLLTNVPGPTGERETKLEKADAATNRFPPAFTFLKNMFCREETKDPS